MEDYCFWIEIDSEDYWEAECNKNEFAFNKGSPVDNGFKFCPYCGRSMKENRPSTQDEEA